ncbi:hypothetical protein BC829DRAFT_399516, partial [Chytridium lagenaria]
MTSHLIDVAPVSAQGQTLPRKNEVARHANGIGILIIAGTDTLDELAFLLDLIMDPIGRPAIAITGSMKPSDIIGFDGPSNVMTPSESSMPSQGPNGASVTMPSATLTPPFFSMEVCKMDARAVNAFRSVAHGFEVGACGRVDRGFVRWLRFGREWFGGHSYIAAATDEMRRSRQLTKLALDEGQGKDGMIISTAFARLVLSDFKRTKVLIMTLGMSMSLEFGGRHIGGDAPTASSLVAALKFLTAAHPRKDTFEENPSCVLEAVDGVIFALPGAGSLAPDAADYLTSEMASTNGIKQQPIVVTTRCAFGPNSDDDFYRGSGFEVSSFDGLSAVKAPTALGTNALSSSTAAIATPATAEAFNHNGVESNHSTIPRRFDGIAKAKCR